ncbi:MAG: LptF/LptG family permease [Phycisphaerae bacterium]|nr:LptF/LptG family permease [Phycisphaerae bacterium]
MIFTLHRYIFRDLFKTFALSTAILSMILGLGTMLKPLREFGVNPASVPELLLCTLPMTMTMVFPIAALLATTLTYGKFAFENEMTACRSSGISLMTLIYPAATLALLVGFATLVMNFHVVPYFIERSEKLVRDDIESIIYRNIEKNGSLGRRMFPGTMVYADNADPENHMLHGVAVVQVNKKDRSKVILTAQSIRIEFHEDKKTNHRWVKLVPKNYLAVLDDGTIMKSSITGLVRDIPSFWRDAIKFKRLKDLKKIQQNMAQFSDISKAIDKIKQQMTVEIFFQRCQNDFNQKGYIELLTDNGNSKVIIYARQCEMRVKKSENSKSSDKIDNEKKTAILLPHENKMVIAEYYYDINDTEPQKTYEIEKAYLEVNDYFNTLSLEAKLNMKNAVCINHRTGNNKTNYGLYDIGLMLPPDIAEKVQREITFQQLTKSELGANEFLLKPSEYMQKQYTSIREKSDELNAEIVAELHSRLAFGVSCVMLTLMGAALGIVFKSGHLLTAFGISFIPAGLCLITIFTGQHIAEQSTSGITGGLTFLWSGVVIVTICNFLLYKFKIRH